MSGESLDGLYIVLAVLGAGWVFGMGLIAGLVWLKLARWWHSR